MATSNSTNFELDVADYIEEAFERCGKTVLRRPVMMLYSGTASAIVMCVWGG